VKVVYSDRHQLHNPQREIESSAFQDPFEHPGRAEIIRAALQSDEQFEFVDPQQWGTKPIDAVHDPGLNQFLATAWDRYQLTVGPTHDVVPDVFSMAALREGMGPAKRPTSVDMELGWWCFETTTPLTSGTYEAARSSVDVALSAAALVVSGESSAYGLCRPPGHHAPRAAYGGYCFFNNAAVAANHLVATTGGKVTVLDVDYHHGNGTQQIFYGRDDVQFVSLHGDPVRAYPYLTGFADEVGTGRGLGNNVNMPMAEGTTDDQFVGALGLALEKIQAFGPSTLVVSLGMDTYYDDPISDLSVTEDGFQRCGALVKELGLPTVVLQEGGYAADQLGENVRRWLVGLEQGIG